jgi:hypothetical protein
MSRIMKRIFVLLLLGAWVVAIAQSPPGEEQAAPADTGEPALPCVSAGAAILPSGQHGPPEPGAVPCEEQDSGDSPGEIVAGPEEKEEEDAVVEASAEEEFTPDDEISEDYPVPLPADM